MEHFSYYCISHTTKWQKYLSLDFDNMENVFYSFVKFDNHLYFAVQIMHDYMVIFIVFCLLSVTRQLRFYQKE